jgi:hypothetical protein
MYSLFIFLLYLKDSSFCGSCSKFIWIWYLWVTGVLLELHSLRLSAQILCCVVDQQSLSTKEQFISFDREHDIQSSYYAWKTLVLNYYYHVYCFACLIVQRNLTQIPRSLMWVHLMGRTHRGFPGSVAWEAMNSFARLMMSTSKMTSISVASVAKCHITIMHLTSFWMLNLLTVCAHFFFSIVNSSREIVTRDF